MKAFPIYFYTFIFHLILCHLPEFIFHCFHLLDYMFHLQFLEIRCSKMFNFLLFNFLSNFLNHSKLCLFTLTEIVPSLNFFFSSFFVCRVSLILGFFFLFHLTIQKKNGMTDEENIEGKFSVIKKKNFALVAGKLTVSIHSLCFF